MVGRALFVLGLLIGGVAHAQAYKPPRTAFGAPDLQGVWNNDAMTPLQRPKAFTSLVATPEAAAAYEKERMSKYEKTIAPVDPNDPAPPPDGVEDDPRADRPPGLARVRGEIRTSWIVNPADGRLPYSAKGRAEADKALKDELIYDHPEGRPFDERCLLGGGGGVAPPIINRNLVQIVQTRDHVVLLAEDNHEARIVRLGDRQHIPPSVRPWMGDPVGWWEGDTLVVETTNLNPLDGWRWTAGEFIRLTSGARIVERFVRTAPHELLYSYVVDDPGAYTQPWRGEMPFRATTAAMFEFACHEGNYALTNILAGARAQENAAVQPKP